MSSDRIMSTAPRAFGAQILGEAEKALNAILDRQLAGTGLAEPDWITLTLATAGSAPGRGELAGRLAEALKVSPAVAQDRIGGLIDAQLLQTGGGGDEPVVTPTDAGRRLHSRIRGAITEITQRMWGDLPAADLQAAGRVLSVVLARANAELAAM